MEHDLLGDKAVPANAYYGVQTARALENFQISNVPMNFYPEFVEAFAIVKVAAARANTSVGAMKPDRLAAIEKAYEAIKAGKYHDQFQVDWYQGGAGTSANIERQRSDGQRRPGAVGSQEGRVSVPRSRTTTSTCRSRPTTRIRPRSRSPSSCATPSSSTSCRSSRSRCARKGNQFLEIPKMGRTELQDAVPMTVGQEFHAFGASLESEIELLKDAEKYLYAVNMGATAIGSGINVPKGYSEAMAKELAKLTGKPIVPATDMFAATWDQQGFVVYSRRRSRASPIKLSKISRRFDPAGVRAARRPRRDQSAGAPARLLDHAGQGQPGDSRAHQSHRVSRGRVTIQASSMAAHSGQLQLNAYEPLVGLAVMESQNLLHQGRACAARTKCVDGITVNEEVLSRYMEDTVGIVTALNPVIGYEKATELANEAYRTNKGLLEIIRERR